MIKPTVGRVVLLWGAHHLTGHNIIVHDLKQPFNASIAFVWSDRMINVGYDDHNGVRRGATSVVLLQDDDLKPEGQPFCTWMPYQLGQARVERDSHASSEGKTEELERLVPSSK